MATQNILLAAALAYAADGKRVFPCQPNGKLPAVKGGRGCLDATTDADTIRGWWHAFPRANVAIALGNGLVGIDVDTHKGADVSAWNLPPTLTVHTASGGQHLYFAYDGILPNVNENVLAHGVCIKSANGYFVAPPSRYASGLYAWEDPYQPMAQLPERIAAMILERRKDLPRIGPPSTPRATSSSEDAGDYWLAKAMQKTGDGNGDATGVWLAQQLLIAQRNGQRVDPQAVLLAYAAQATRNPRDPFDGRSVARWLRSAGESKIVQRGEPARGAAPLQKAPANITRISQRPVMQANQPRTDGSSALKADEDHVVTDPLLLRGEADDNGNAEAMWRLFGHELLYTPAIGWLRWTGTHWTETPEPVVTQRAITTLKRRRIAAVRADKEPIVKVTKQDKARVTACRDLFKSYVIEPDVSAFDADPDTLNCLNGVLDLRTGALTPHNPAQRFTYCLSVAWDPDADMTTWTTFLLDALGGDQVAADYFQLCAGYSLTGHTREEKMFYLYGPTRAGKGTATETLLRLLPRPLSSEVDFATFTAKRDNDSQNFDLAELKPARLVVASESNRAQALNPAKIKQLTGGNHVRCAFKHRDMFSYRPQFKVWLVSNWEVKADPDDTAVWGRVQIFTFPNSHLGAEDMTLKDRMKSPEVLQGVLRWAVAGARRWFEVGRLTAPASIAAVTEAQRGGQDYIRQWLDDCCSLDKTYWAQSTPLVRSYTAWCEANNIEPRKASDLADTLIRRFNCTPKRQAGTGLRGFSGVSLTIAREGVTA